jgi:hypothetical protein
MIEQYLPNKTKVILFIELKFFYSRGLKEARSRGHGPWAAIMVARPSPLDHQKTAQTYTYPSGTVHPEKEIMFPIMKISDRIKRCRYCARDE